MGWLANKTSKTRTLFFVVAALLLIAAEPFPLQRVYAAPLTQRSIRVSDANASANNVTYRIGLTTATNFTLGSIRIQFCSNTPLIGDSCVPPAGFDASATALSGQGGVTNFVLSPASTANELILSRPPTLQAPAALNYTFTNIINPAAGGTFYGRILTYPTSDATGPYTDAGGLAMHIHAGLGISTVVPPLLTFCVGESITGFDCTTATEAFTNLGILSSTVTSAAQSQMLVSTNADNGYSVWYIGPTMTSGNNTIPAMAAAGPSQAGVGQFGLNLRANTNPVVGQNVSGPGVGGIVAAYNQQNQFKFTSGDTLATSADPDDYRKYTVSYIVNIPPTQAGGVYATTLTYIALANF